MKRGNCMALATSGCCSDLGYDAVKNIGGSWTRDELLQSSKIFNISYDLATRQKMLHRFFSAKYIVWVEIDGLGNYVPERISDSSYVKEFKEKISLQGSVIVAYNPPISAPCEQKASRSPNKRTWRIPLETVKKVILKKNGILSIKIAKYS